MPVTAPTWNDVRIFGSSGEFRAWLDENHQAAAHLWVGYYKKGVPKVAMTYVQAVEEALCFGWIDGITYRMDAEVTATRFTPRRRTSGWSAINIARVAALTAAGRMRPAGLRAFEERDRRKDAVYSYDGSPAALPVELIERLMADPAAWARWQEEAPSYRRAATYWIMSAKRPETRERRFATLLAESAAGRRPRPFVVERAGHDPAREMHQ